MIRHFTGGYSKLRYISGLAGADHGLFSVPNGQNRRGYHKARPNNRQRLTQSVAGAAVAVVGLSWYYLNDSGKRVWALKKDLQVEEVRQWHDEVRKDLPTYAIEEVAKHSNSSDGIWVTYGIGVYDITKFVPEHPGSDKVMLAAGSAIDPFWHIFQQHNTVEVLELLESFRIGNLDPTERASVSDLGDPWAQEPKRHPVLKPASLKPFNAEPPPSLLIDSFLTPNEFFYVRNHLPVPTIDINEYEIELEIEGNKKTIQLTMKDLKKFPEYTVTAAIMCGGNRRSEMTKVKAVKGLNWGPSAVGNAEWTGVRLRDVLVKHGLKSDEVRHVQFEGIDRDPTYTPYGASIPLSKAMDERGDVLLAYKMNGKELSRDHGYPVRVVVPGVVGARNVKWLGKITVSSKESDSHWQQNDYKGFSPSTDWDTVDFSNSPAIQNMPVTSAICSPLEGESLKVDGDGTVSIKGYAWSGGGNRIVRVDVTADGGKSWQCAELQQQDERTAPSGRHFGWTLWTAKVKVPSKGSEITICSKAVDSNYNVQPETFENTWNLRGVLSHAYSRVKVKLQR